MEALGSSTEFFQNVQEKIAQLRDEVYIMPPKPPAKKTSESSTKSLTTKKKDGEMTHEELVRYFDDKAEKYVGADIVIRP